jgi:hypothetical protein
VMPFLTLLKSKGYTHINDKYSLILTDEQSSHKNLGMLDSKLLRVGSLSRSIPTRANVAIAAAITSYARIHMMNLKLNNDVCYSDTDSIFTTHPLPEYLVGPEIGQLKDELAGLTIDKAYFIGAKQYGYTYTDLDGNRIDKSVWAGVTKDSLPFQTLESVAKGVVHHILADKRFFRDFTNLNIAIKPVTIKVVDKKDKLLVDNQYYPACINNPYHLTQRTKQQADYIKGSIDHL